MGEIVYTIGESRLFTEGFQTNEMRQARSYKDINKIKINGDKFKISYINHNGKNKNTTLQLSNGREQIRAFFMTKCTGIESRKRTFFESFMECSPLFIGIFSLTMIVIALFYVFPSNSGTVRVPIIIIPAIKAIEYLGIVNTIYINIGVFILTLIGTVVSFKKEHQIETLYNF